MKFVILLSYSENVKKIEEEEKQKFLHYLLTKMDVPVHYNADDKLTIEQKSKLQELLLAFHIQVLDEGDGSMQIFVDNELAGTFHKPTYKIKKDLNEVDRKKQIYLEMTVEETSVFE